MTNGRDERDRDPDALHSANDQRKGKMNEEISSSTSSVGVAGTQASNNGPTVYTDDMVLERLKAARPYSVVILNEGPNYLMPGADRIIWEHGRRNMGLQLDGQVAIVCPIMDRSELCGIYIFAEEPETVDQIMAQDPGVVAGVFTYQVHPARGFPGSALPW
jgi:hypothetical protein